MLPTDIWPASLFQILNMQKYILKSIVFQPSLHGAKQEDMSKLLNLHELMGKAVRSRPTKLLHLEGKVYTCMLYYDNQHQVMQEYC